MKYGALKLTTFVGVSFFAMHEWESFLIWSLHSKIINTFICVNYVTFKSKVNQLLIIQKHLHMSCQISYFQLLYVFKLNNNTISIFVTIAEVNQHFYFNQIFTFTMSQKPIPLVLLIVYIPQQAL